MLLQMVVFHSFLWLSSIPMSVCMRVCTHHIFIHSSVSGHLGCFHGLAVVNSAALACLDKYKKFDYNKF